MTDTIRECYGTLCRTLDDLSGEPSLPDTISEPLKKAHEIMSMLGDTAREKTWKVMKVMTAHQNACKLIVIVDLVSKILKDVPKDSNTTAQAPTLCRRVSKLSSAIEEFNDARIPETWKFEIERRCPAKLSESLKSPYDTIIDTLAALKHSLSGLSVAFGIYIQPLPIPRPAGPPGPQKVRQTVHSPSHVGYFDTQSIRLSQHPRPDTFTEIHFPHSYIAPPRLPHGFSYIDVDHCADIRVKAAIEEVKKPSAVYHATFWEDTVLYRMIITSFNLGPAHIDFLTGEHSCDLVKNPSSPHSLRINSKRINFEPPFVTPPKVVAFFNLLDMDQKQGCRIRTTTSEIDRIGFTLTIESWGDTTLRCARACWIAYPEDRRHIFSASVNTRGISPMGKEWKNAIKYTDVKFWRTPDVFVALNEIDSDGQFDLRIKAYVANVTTIGLTWHIDTWSDSVLRSAGATIIAVN
ncbi:hypothetical protein BYT27DRAFT_6742060 [Phlegmacium glaucopus]|nr:hypothetical protein BYT27DRAFT_6742060 [Phlegmacium glaucopus]